MRPNLESWPNLGHMHCSILVECQFRIIFSKKKKKLGLPTLSKTKLDSESSLILIWQIVHGEKKEWTK